MPQSHFHPTYIIGTILWTLFFQPLTSNAYLSNAFALPYIGITSLCLYASIGMYSITAWPIYHFLWRNKNPETLREKKNDFAITVAMGLALLGVLVKLGSYVDYQKDGLFFMYCIGHLMIALSACIYFTISIVHLKG